jgi:hypothetical protein
MHIDGCRYNERLNTKTEGSTWNVSYTLGSQVEIIVSLVPGLVVTPEGVNWRTVEFLRHKEFIFCVVYILDGIPGTRAPGHRSPGPWSQGIFLFYFIFYFGGSSFYLTKNKKKHCFLSVFSLFHSLFLSFSVHTLSVLLSLVNFTNVSCEGKLKKGVAYKL